MSVWPFCIRLGFLLGVLGPFHSPCLLYPCDDPGRGGTCQISPWDHVFLHAVCRVACNASAGGRWAGHVPSSTPGAKAARDRRAKIADADTKLSVANYHDDQETKARLLTERTAELSGVLNDPALVEQASTLLPFAVGHTIGDASQPGETNDIMGPQQVLKAVFGLHYKHFTLKDWLSHLDTISLIELKAWLSREILSRKPVSAALAEVLDLHPFAPETDALTALTRAQQLPPLPKGQ